MFARLMLWKIFILYKIWILYPALLSLIILLLEGEYFYQLFIHNLRIFIVNKLLLNGMRTRDKYIYTKEFDKAL